MAKFTKGHLEDLAELIRENSCRNWFRFLHEMCLMLRISNPTFSRKKFIEAAGFPYFDEVRKGVAVTIEYCIDCGIEVVNVVGEKPDQMCVKCLRKVHADLIDQ